MRGDGSSDPGHWGQRAGRNQERSRSTVRSTGHGGGRWTQVPSPGLPLATEEGRRGPGEAPPHDPGTPAPPRPGEGPTPGTMRGGAGADNRTMGPLTPRAASCLSQPGLAGRGTAEAGAALGAACPGLGGTRQRPRAEPERRAPAPAPPDAGPQTAAPCGPASTQPRRRPAKGVAV